MAEPMSKTEDAVTSIRRLVADDLSARPESNQPQMHRLMLTEALRVYPDPPAKSALPPLLLTSPVNVPKPAPLPLTSPITVKRRLHLVTDSQPVAIAPEVVVERHSAARDAVQPEAALQLLDGVSEPVISSELAQRLADIEALLDSQDQIAFETEARPVVISGPEPKWGRADEAPFVDADAEPGLVPQVSADIRPISPEVQESEDEEDPIPEVVKPLVMNAAEEAALRALIRRVLLDELSTETGERVTRNLRKMVRAEILRALSARKLT